jgi:hypothetical protein
MAKIETIKIQSGDSFAIINKSDFDPKKHKEITLKGVNHMKAKEIITEINDSGFKISKKNLEALDHVDLKKLLTEVRNGSK